MPADNEEEDMKKMILPVALLLMTNSVWAQSNTNAVSNQVIKVKVTGDRVSLRARPGIDSELLDRAMRGEEFIYFTQTNDWVAVEAPDTIDCWVAGDFLQEGVVQPKKLNVRSGPSLNYSVIAMAHKGDRLTSRGEFNGWVKVVPPKGSRVWISKKYVQIIEPPKPKPKPQPKPKPPPVVKKPAIPPAPPLTDAERKPLLLILDKTKEQGVYDEVPGVLRRANPGLYKLVFIDGDTEEAICLVRGQHNQMERYLNRSMLIKGKKYWAKGVNIPILQPLKIHLDPILDD